jgi:hypothetical protein
LAGIEEACVSQGPTSALTNGRWPSCAACWRARSSVIAATAEFAVRFILRWLCAALVIGCAAATTRAQPAAPEQARVRGGAVITPELAQALYGKLVPLKEPDGCRLVSFNTDQSGIAVSLQPPSGVVHVLKIGTEPGLARRVGGWGLAVPIEIERDCGTTLAAIERVLSDTAAPQMRAEAREPPQRGPSPPQRGLSNYDLLVATLLLLGLGTVHVLYREVKLDRPSPYAVAALLVVSAAALLLRLSISPRTFLHEYFHYAHTVPAYLAGRIGPVYGNTGPTLYHLTAAVLGRPDDYQIIFLTTALVSSLAIPAVALLDLALMRSWPRALCAALLLCVLPLHLRFSAAEDLFVHAVTFGLWALALFALYLRTQRLEDALLCALALSLGMQTRPEMLFFPAALVALLLCVEPRSWRLLFAWRTLLMAGVLAALLIPRLLAFADALQAAPAVHSPFPDRHRYLSSLMLFQSSVTPAAYWLVLVAGLAWSAAYHRGLLLWVTVVFCGSTFFSVWLYSDRAYLQRSQLLPTSLTVLIAAGAASLWMQRWGRRRHLALAGGAVALAALGAVMLLSGRDFVQKLYDQQLEWAFLARSVPKLPPHGTLLSAIDMVSRQLDVFPQFLLRHAGKTYATVDVRSAATGAVPWPAPSEDLLYYQGMFCYFTFVDEPAPDPMTAPCQAVLAHYVAEPLLVEDLDAPGYSGLQYAPGPYRIGFFRLQPRR